jgi:hypothetical protein
MWKKKSIAPVTGALVLAACIGIAVAATTVPEQREERVLGVLELHSEPTVDVIDAPSWARAGEPFVVVVRTYGSGCERVGDAGVIVSRDTASIMLYDFTRATTPNVVCAMVRKRFVHAVVVQFDRPANATIRVWGRRLTAGLPPAGEPIVLEHQLLVTR